MATATITEAGVQGDLASSVVTFTEAGVGAAPTSSAVTIINAAHTGTLLPAAVTLTEAGFLGQNTQGNPGANVVTRVSIAGVWRQIPHQWADVAGVWVEPDAIYSPPNPVNKSQVVFTEGSVTGTPSTQTPGPGGWSPNTGVMQRLDRGFDDRLPGVPVVWYEDLYQSGDTVSQAMARLTTQAVISFPEGRFQQSDFRTNGSYRSIDIPKNCRGIYGSGRGAVGSSTGTVFSMAPNTSTRAGDVPAQDNSTPVQMRLMYQGGALNSDLHYAQFRVEGTEQGHIYHNFTLYNPPGRVRITDVLSHGHYGNNGAPPGETFGIEVHGNGNNLTNPSLLRCEFDGRRTIGGKNYGAVGFDFANVIQGDMRDCYSHHTNFASFVLFQCFNVKTYDMRCGDPSDTDGTGIDNRNMGGWINHERTAGCEHYRPIQYRVFKGVGKTVHMTHSNDSYVQGGYSSANGSVKVVDPTFNDIWGNGAYYIQSWHPYWTGCSMNGASNTGIPAVPFVSRTDGAPNTFRYVHTFTPVAGKHTTA